MAHELSAAVQQCVFSLPWPPTDNQRAVLQRGKIVRAREVQRYYENAWLCLRASPYFPMTTITCLVEAWIVLHPPDKRRRDGSNVLKALFDALHYKPLAGSIAVLQDDSLIQAFHVSKGIIKRGGEVEVIIRPYSVSDCFSCEGTLHE